MNTIKTTLTTDAVFTDDGSKRYLLHKTWDKNKHTLAIIMLAPSEASGIVLDKTTMLVLNNASRLGFGSVTILNLFATLDDFDLKRAELDDEDNLKMIVSVAEAADVVVYAAGVGKAKNKLFQERQRQVLEALRPMEYKLFCLCNQAKNARLQHPLSPAMRVWEMVPLKINELVIAEPTANPVTAQKKKSKRRTIIEKL